MGQAKLASLVLIGMASKGSFSYTNTTITGFNIGNGLQIRVEAINKHVASMSVTDINGNLQPIPPKHHPGGRCQQGRAAVDQCVSPHLD